MAKYGVINLAQSSIAAVGKLKESENKAAVLRHLARIGAELSAEKELAETIVQHGLHAAVLNQAFVRNDEEIGVHATEMFKNLVLSVANIRTMRQDGTLETVTGLEEKYDDNDAIATNLAEMAQRVAQTEGGSIEEVIALTLNAIQNHTEADQVNEDLIFLLNKMNAKGGMEALIQAGGLQIVTAVMQDHSGNQETQKQALALLEKIAEYDPEMLLQFCKNGGLGICAKAMRALFNCPEVVEKNIAFLRRVAGNKEALEYFINRGTADTKMVAWAGKAYAGKNKKISDDAAFILQKVHDHHQAIYLMKKEEERKIELAKAAAAEEERKRRGRGVTKEEMVFILEGLGTDQDMEAFDGLVGMLSNTDNADLFVDAGGYTVMRDIILSGTADDEAFNAAVLCFNSSIGDGKKLLEILGDKNSLDLMMKILDPKRNLEWDKLGNTIQAVLTLTSDKDILQKMLNKGDLKGALLMAAKQGKSEEMLIAAMKTLARISNDKKEMKEWATKANIQALLEAMEKNMDKPNFLMYACYLLGNLALNEHVQSLIGELGGVRVLAECHKRYPEHQELIDKACYAQRMLSIKNSVNCGLIIRYEVHKLVLAAMHRHTEAGTRFWVNLLGLLLNLCKTGSTTSELLQKEGADLRVIEVIYSNSEENVVVKVCCKVLERLATRKTYRQLLENSIVHALNPSLSKSSRYADSVVAAMKVFQRLASYAKTDRDAMALFLAENAHKAVVNCVRQHRENAAILGASVDCLTHFACDEMCSTTIVRMRIVEVLRVALEELQYDERFCTSAMNLIDRLTVTASNLRAIVDSNVVKEMCVVTATYISCQIMVYRFLSATRRICGQSDFGVRLADDVIPALVKITSDYLSDNAVLLECFSTMKSLTFSDITAVPIAKMSCVLAIKAMKAHYSYVPLQRICLEYFTSLFLQPKAVEEAVFSTKVLEDLSEKIRTADGIIVEKILEALYHVAIATNKVKDHMKGLEMVTKITEIKTKFASEETIVGLCNRVIRAINTAKVDLENLNFDIGPTETFIDTATVWNEKKKRDKAFVMPAKLKNFLVAGMEVKLHKSKKVVDTHLKVNKTLKKIMWTNGKGGAHQFMGTWRVKRIKTGIVSKNLEHRRAGYKVKSPLENRVFVIMGEDTTVSVEVQMESMRNKWVKALKALIQHHKQGKRMATDFVRDGAYKEFKTTI